VVMTCLKTVGETGKDHKNLRQDSWVSPELQNGRKCGKSQKYIL